MQEQYRMHPEELLGAYALDAVDEDERRRVEQHLSECPNCLVEVHEHREVAALLSGEFVQPPEQVWGRILAEITTATPAHELAPVIPIERERQSVSFRSVVWGAGVAAAMLVALSAALLTQSGRISDLNSQLTAQEQQIETLAATLQTEPLQLAATAALTAPGAEVINLTADDASGEMRIVVLPDGTGYVFQSTLEPLPADSTYQLWAVVDDKVISAGVLGSRPDVVPFHIDPEGLQGLVITQEVAGGVSQSEADPVAAWFKA
jgi:hypothetical protein